MNDQGLNNFCWFRSATKLQSEASDECAQLAKTSRNVGSETKALAQRNDQLLNVQADIIVTISSTVANISSRTQSTELQDKMQKVLESKMRILTTVRQMEQLQADFPPQIQRQQPVYFEDAHERLSPVHLEFIGSFAAFQAVLKDRFKQVPGLRKVEGLEYAMQDTASKKAFDLSKPWESIFRPGRKVVMSMLFQQVESTVTSCPGCFEDVRDDQDGEQMEDTQIQWCEHLDNAFQGFETDYLLGY